MAAIGGRRGLVTTLWSVTALTSIVVIALIATPSGPRPGSLDTRGVLGHEAVAADEAVAFAPEALSELGPQAEAPVATGDSNGPKVLRLVYFIEADAPVDREAPDADAFFTWDAAAFRETRSEAAETEGVTFRWLERVSSAAPRA